MGEEIFQREKERERENKICFNVLRVVKKEC